MKVSMQKSQKTHLIAVNFITSENENCIFLPHIFIPMRRDHPEITFQRSMTHTACVACGPKTTDFSRFPEKRHSTKVLGASVVAFVTKLDAKHNRQNP